MRLLTPEIAWHETLPIYSCDLQPQQDCSSEPAAYRPPLTDITASDHVRSSLIYPAERPWTRLATAGGDNIVRLWRVYLDTVSSNFEASRRSKNKIVGGFKKSSQTVDAHGINSHIADLLLYTASLKRHEKPVNVVRWSPSGSYLASAGDDLFIFIWAIQTGPQTAAVSSSDIATSSGKYDEEDEAAASLEHWVPCRTLRRHLEDIYDLCWSPDNLALISGSVDHSVILWQLDLVPPSSTDTDKQKSAPATEPFTQPPTTPSTGSGNTKCIIIRDHKHYVQGVTWDPLGFYVASLSSDRACRIYRAGTRNCLAHVSKASKQRLFQDDSWKSFFRRLSFSPDGLLLACPSGNLEDAPFAGSVAAAASIASTNPTESSITTTNPALLPKVSPQHAAHLFIRSNLTKPVISLPTGPRPVVAVRFCHQPFQLRPVHHGPDPSLCHSLFNLPYRWLFCLVLEDGVLLYDTQQTVPFAQISQMHYQALNDATWSDDGHLLITCSTDGYCSLIRFAHGELGTPYRGVIGANALNTIPPPLPTDEEALTGRPMALFREQEQTKNNVPMQSNSTTVNQTGQQDLTRQSNETECPALILQNNVENIEEQKTEPIKKRRVALITLPPVEENIPSTTPLDPPKDVSDLIHSNENPTGSKPKRRVSFVTLAATSDSRSDNSPPVGGHCGAVEPMILD